MQLGTRHTIVCLLVIGTAVLPWQGTRADETASDPVFDAKGFQQARDYFSPLPFENVDTTSGNLVLTFTDFILPGNAGFDLRLTRTYNSKNSSWSIGIAGVPLSVAPLGTNAESGALRRTRLLHANIYHG